MTRPREGWPYRSWKSRGIGRGVKIPGKGKAASIRPETKCAGTTKSHVVVKEPSADLEEEGRASRTCWGDALRVQEGQTGSIDRPAGRAYGKLPHTPTGEDVPKSAGKAGEGGDSGLAAIGLLLLGLGHPRRNRGLKKAG